MLLALIAGSQASSSVTSALSCASDFILQIP
jgi:hypothetical protein